MLDDLAQLEGSPAEAPLRAAPSNRPTGQFIQRPNFPLSLPVPGDNPGAEGTLIDFEGGRAGHGDRLRVGHPQTVTSALAAAGQPDAFDRVMRLVAGMPSDELKAFPNRLWGTVDDVLQERVNMPPPQPQWGSSLFASRASILSRSGAYSYVSQSSTRPSRGRTHRAQ